MPLFPSGTFIEFRNGMINVSPVGRNCTKHERDSFFAYDAVRLDFSKNLIRCLSNEKEHQIRSAMVKDLQEKFSHMGLAFSIGMNSIYPVLIQ